MPGGDTGPLGIKHQFAKTDGYAACPLITDTQDSLVISHYGNSDITMPVTVQNVLSIINVPGIYMHPVGGAEHGRVLLTGKTNRRRINYFHEARDICGNNSMGQGDIPVKQGAHIDVAFYVILFIQHLFSAVLNLLIKRPDSRRQTAVHTKIASFRLSKGGALVDIIIAVHAYTTRVNFDLPRIAIFVIDEFIAFCRHQTLLQYIY